MNYRALVEKQKNITDVAKKLLSFDPEVVKKVALNTIAEGESDVTVGLAIYELYGYLMFFRYAEICKRSEK